MSKSDNSPSSCASGSSQNSTHSLSSVASSNVADVWDETGRPQESSPGFCYSPRLSDDSPSPVLYSHTCKTDGRLSRSIRHAKKVVPRFQTDPRDKVDELCGVNDELKREAEELESLLSKTQRDREKDQDMVRELQWYTDTLGTKLNVLEEELEARDIEKRETNREVVELKRTLKRIQGSRLEEERQKEGTSSNPVSMQVLQLRLKKLRTTNEELRGALNSERITRQTIAENLLREKAEKSMLQSKVTTLSALTEVEPHTARGSYLSMADSDFGLKDVLPPLGDCNETTMLRSNSDPDLRQTANPGNRILRGITYGGNCEKTNLTPSVTNDCCISQESRSRPVGMAGLNMAKVFELRDRENTTRTSTPVMGSLIDDIMETVRSELDSDGDEEFQLCASQTLDPAKLAQMCREREARQRVSTERSLATSTASSESVKWPLSSRTKTFCMMHAEAVCVNESPGSEASHGFGLKEFRVDKSPSNLAVEEENSRTHNSGVQRRQKGGDSGALFGIALLPRILSSFSAGAVLSKLTPRVSCGASIDDLDSDELINGDGEGKEISELKRSNLGERKSPSARSSERTRPLSPSSTPSQPIASPVSVSAIPIYSPAGFPFASRKCKTPGHRTPRRKYLTPHSSGDLGAISGRREGQS